MGAYAAKLSEKPMVPEGSESALQERLYRLCLMGGLGPRARFLARLAETACRGAWDGELAGKNRGINAGSPLEFSLRSNKCSGVNFATVVGTDALPAYERLRLGMDSAEMLERSLEETRPSIVSSLKDPIHSWLTEQKHDYGGFGSYIGMSLNRSSWKLKLYLDLFARRYSRDGLVHWADLMRRCGADFHYAESVAGLCDIATPSMGCIVLDKSGTASWRLYWRLREYSHKTMERVCAVFHVNEQARCSVEHIIQQSSGHHRSQKLTVGFVHETPVTDGRLGFYSTAPSRWACTPRKRQQIQRLWQEFGGQPLVLNRTWQLASSGRSNSVLPTLTIIGADVRDETVRGLSAYFCPNR